MKRDDDYDVYFMHNMYTAILSKNKQEKNEIKRENSN